MCEGRFLRFSFAGQLEASGMIRAALFYLSATSISTGCPHPVQSMGRRLQLSFLQNQPVFEPLLGHYGKAGQ